MNDINFVFCKNVCEPYVLLGSQVLMNHRSTLRGRADQSTRCCNSTGIKLINISFFIDLHIFISDFQESFVTNNISTFYERFMLKL